ncbi:MAG: Gfo/Idh/MocA family oxidoreductase [Planctomycetota bacterium]
MSRHRVVAINFDHMHMGDLLRLVVEHPDAEVVGVWHHEPDTPREVLGRLGLDESLIFDDWRACMEQASPTVAIVCASTGGHGEWACKVAEYGVDVLVEKPFAANLTDADAMTEAVHGRGKRLAINWPLAWYPPHRTAKRMVDEGLIGELRSVTYYDGNRGPARHKMDKIETVVHDTPEAKNKLWWYRKDQAGGSMQDYLGYGTTLATWYHNGHKPIEVTCMVDEPTGLEVDEHSVTVARYETGLSKFETRWGTFTDPWSHQPQPRCGFVLCGSAGTISSYDYQETIHVQTEKRPEGHDIPVDPLVHPYTDGVNYFLDCIDNDRPIEGPLSPEVCRIGQQIVDTAARSAVEKKTLPLLG